MGVGWSCACFPAVFPGTFASYASGTSSRLWLPMAFLLAFAVVVTSVISAAITGGNHVVYMKPAASEETHVATRFWPAAAGPRVAVIAVLLFCIWRQAAVSPAQRRQPDPDRAPVTGSRNVSATRCDEA